MVRRGVTRKMLEIKEKEQLIEERIEFLKKEIPSDQINLKSINMDMLQILKLKFVVI